MSWLARLDAFLIRRARERSEGGERTADSATSGCPAEAEVAKEAALAGEASGGGAPSFAGTPPANLAEALEPALPSPPSLLSQRRDAAALLRAAEAAAEALAGREPDPVEEAERAAIRSEPELPPEGTDERRRLDRDHRTAVRGLLDAFAPIALEPTQLPHPAAEYPT